MTEDDPCLSFLSLEEAKEPKKPGFYQLMLNRWWMTHPEKGLILYRPNKKAGTSPQCNANKELAEAAMEKMYPWAKSVFVERAFVEIDPRWYA